MEKKKYNVVIAGCEMSIISDEREELVQRLVSIVDEQIMAITEHSRSCSKLDAAILVALDYAGEKAKAEKRCRNLEAQIQLYDTNLRRSKDEIARLKSSMLGNKIAEPEAEIEVPVEEVPADEVEDDTQIRIDEAEKVEDTQKKADKISAIEDLLRGRGI